MPANQYQSSVAPRLVGTSHSAISILALLVLALCSQQVRSEVWITEFLADNESGLRTKAGIPTDWIELANTSAQAVDLSGWFLTDRATAPAKWRFPNGTTIAGNGYLIVFADSSEIALTNGELHANFSLSKDGEYLGLVGPDGVSVIDQFSPGFPPQYKDISYGRGAPSERTLLPPEAPSRYRIPNADDTAAWLNGAGSLGFSRSNAPFSVRYYEMNTSVANVDDAEAMVADSGYWMGDQSYPVETQHDTIDFHANGNSGAFTNDVMFPGHTHPGEDRDNFVVVAEASIRVPSAGLWTFAVGSDDGFRLRISGHDVDFTAEYPSGRSFGTSLATFNFPVAGVYSLQLVFFENGGDASLELSAAPDFQETFSPELFHLVGDLAGPILHAGSIGSLVNTDVAANMEGINSRLDAEWTFTIDELPAVDDLFTLSMLCADGFSAQINGTPVASLNVPASLSWNSTATAARLPEQVLQPLIYRVPPTVLRLGTNTLLVTALNNAVADPDFLVAPSFSWRAAPSLPAYFKKPTPGAANAQAFSAPTPVVTASEARGYKTSPISVALSCPMPDAQIRYTLDGSLPRTNSPLYTNALAVSRTTTLRAAVLDPNTVRQNVTTVTYLFLADIVRQPSTPPAGWPGNRQVNNHVMEYGLRQQVVTSDTVRLCNGITNAIGTISLVTDLANLFSPQRGIYVNPGNDGIGWERPVSVELIDPVGGQASEFQIDAGLRIRGAYSRSSSNPKHSFRLFFRSSYGEGKLRFPLFGDEGASEFDKVDLRTSQNVSWAYENSSQETFIRETFSRDSQRDMGMPYTRSRYYHLYLNGQYWGLYQTQERGDSDFAETYLGGRSADWDCIKTTQPGYTTTASDGNFNAFFALHNLAMAQGFTGAYANNYYKVKGLNPDGTRNPAYPVYLDEDNLIVYMLTAYYTGDPDSPVSIWGGMPNNMYALFNRAAPGGFKWLRHDAEHSLGSNGGYPVTCDTTTAGAGFTSRGNFNPATLHQRLCQHPEYRRRFADLVQKHLYGDGALTTPKAQERFRSRMNEIDLAIIGESARWGRGKTRENAWLPTCNSVVDNYLVLRRDILVGQFRNRGWLPSIDAPAYSIMNREVVPGQVVRIAGSSSFYYTTNGTDPRLPDGSVNPAAIRVSTSTEPTPPRTLVARGADWRYYDQGSQPASSGNLTWRDLGFPDGSWPHGPAILGFPGSATANSVATRTRRFVNGVSAPQVTTTYFRHTFTVSSTNNIPGLQLGLLRDDGVVVYLNGTEVLRDNMNPGVPAYSTYSAGVVGSPDQNTFFVRPLEATHLLRPGTNTLAVEVHQCNSGSSDLYLDLSLTVPGVPAYALAELSVSKDLTLKARGLSGSEWSGLSENILTIPRPPPNYATLRISEIMYAPPAPAPGGPYSDDDFAWLELRNSGAFPLDLAGVSFTAGITHTFERRFLAPGARLVLAENLSAFATRYETNGLNVLEWENGNLARNGETLSLTAPQATNILTFKYSSLWYPETFDTAYSLLARDLAAPEPLWSTPGNWRPSSTRFGTPGRAEPPEFANARVAGGHLLVEVAELEDVLELWVSEDLHIWTRCAEGAWSRSATGIQIDLEHPSLTGWTNCFFQLRANGSGQGWP